MQHQAMWVGNRPGEVLLRWVLAYPLLQALSVTLRERTLDSALRNVAKLKAAVDKCKATDAQRLRSEYDRLIGGLQARAPFGHYAC